MFRWEKKKSGTGTIKICSIKWATMKFHDSQFFGLLHFCRQRKFSIMISISRRRWNTLESRCLTWNQLLPLQYSLFSFGFHFLCFAPSLNLYLYQLIMSTWLHGQLKQNIQLICVIFPPHIGPSSHQGEGLSYNLFHLFGKSCKVSLYGFIGHYSLSARHLSFSKVVPSTPWSSTSFFYAIAILMSQSGPEHFFPMYLCRLLAKYRPTMPVISVVVPRLKTNQLKWTFSGAFEVYATSFNFNLCSCVESLTISVLKFLHLETFGTALGVKGDE